MPYTAEVDGASLLREPRLAVHGGAHRGISDGFRLAEPAALFALGLEGIDPRSDALVISCLNTRSHTVIAAIGKPVISSTQVTLWHALCPAGIKNPIAGYGRLLEGH